MGKQRLFEGEEALGTSESNEMNLASGEATATESKVRSLVVKDEFEKLALVEVLGLGLEKYNDVNPNGYAKKLTNSMIQGILNRIDLPKD